MPDRPMYKYNCLPRILEVDLYHSQFMAPLIAYVDPAFQQNSDLSGALVHAVDFEVIITCCIKDLDI